MNKLFTASTILYSILLSCSNDTGTPSTAPSTDTPMHAAVQQTASTSAVTAAMPEDFPAETGYTARLLTTGIFHEDEVWPDAASFSWLGLFRNDTAGYYIDPAKITTRRVHDPVLDEKDQQTAWEVSTENRDSSVLLISGSKYLVPGPVPTIPLKQKELLPGQTQSFTYNGVTYTLTATGHKKRESPGSEYYLISDYKLYLSATIDGRAIKQLLVSRKQLDETMIRIELAGDMDGDGKPDLIIDTSYHYNALMPTLYLSKPAKPGQLVVPVAMHVSVGC